MLPRTKGLLSIVAWGLLMLLAFAVRAEPTTTVDTPSTFRERFPAPDQEALLRLALARLEEIRDVGGWVTIPDGPPLGIGAHSERVVALRARLAQNCEWLPSIDPARFDTALAAAVRRFQRRCGLPADGVVGAATLAVLNTPVEHRIHQVTANLARLERWVPPPARRWLEVNVPEYRLRYIVDGQVVLAMPVVVGRPDRPTPLLESAVERLRLNPPWNVPQKLARHDLLPHLKRDPGYATRLQLRVFASWADGAPELDPAAIDWAALRPEHLAYRFQAAPGPRNPLGRLMFLFPNPWRVFLHDTSRPALFSRPRRCFSSGCVRLAEPLALARRLLADDPVAEPAALDSLLATGRTVELGLAEAVPVRIVYRTAWVDGGGTLQFREDVYGLDEQLWRELQGDRDRIPVVVVADGEADGEVSTR